MAVKTKYVYMEITQKCNQSHTLHKLPVQQNQMPYALLQDMFSKIEATPLHSDVLIMTLSMNCVG